MAKLRRRNIDFQDLHCPERCLLAVAGEVLRTQKSYKDKLRIYR